MKFAISALILGYVAFVPVQGRAQVAPHGEKEARATLERLCAPDPDKATREGDFAESLAKNIHLNEAQRALFKEFQLVREKSVEANKTRLCAHKPELTSFAAYLAFLQTLLENRLATVKAENPKLIMFYDSLDAEQKSKFETVREQLAIMRGQ